jgi:mycoredoxin
MNEKILFYGTNWCPTSRRARAFLEKNGIVYEFINIDDDKKAEDFVRKTNNGFRSIPTIVFADGSILVEPSNKELSIKLGL